jgi:ubiquinone/menaquinone biosynthesis C-methylase UbiE
VTGVDLTDPFCKVAGMLSARVGLTDRTDFQVCDALEMPFPDRQFDAVWTEHVQMNIADKSTFYGEIKRVLKARGTFLFHDLFAGESGELHYPLPWAGDASINHLVSVESIERTMNDLGFERLRWEDKTGESADFFRGALEHISTNGWHPAGLHLVIGKNAEIKFTNLLRNLEEDRLRVVQAVLKRDLS